MILSSSVSLCSAHFWGKLGRRMSELSLNNAALSHMSDILSSLKLHSLLYSGFTSASARMRRSNKWEDDTCLCLYLNASHIVYADQNAYLSPAHPTVLSVYPQLLSVLWSSSVKQVEAPGRRQSLTGKKPCWNYSYSGHDIKSSWIEKELCACRLNTEDFAVWLSQYDRNEKAVR